MKDKTTCFFWHIVDYDGHWVLGLYRFKKYSTGGQKRVKEQLEHNMLFNVHPMQNSTSQSKHLSQECSWYSRLHWLKHQLTQTHVLPLLPTYIHRSSQPHHHTIAAFKTVEAQCVDMEIDQRTPLAIQMVGLASVPKTLGNLLFAEEIYFDTWINSKRVFKIFALWENTRNM